MTAARLMLAAVGVLAALVRASADDLPAAAAPALSRAGASHAWVALPLAEGGAAIVHLPRQTGEPGARDAGDGAVRLGTRLPARPEALAAWETTLYLAFPPEELGGGRRQRRVVRLTVEQGPIGGTWSSESEPRLPPLPSLPGDGTLEGFVGSPAGPVALLREKSRSRSTLLLFNGTAWRPLDLPEPWQGHAPGAPPARLVATPDGLAMAVLSGGEPGLWTAGLRMRPADQEERGPRWAFEPLSMQGPGGRTAGVPDSAPYLIQGRLVYITRTRDGRTAEIWNPTASRSLLLQRVPEIGEDLAVVALDEPGRLALLWQEYDGEPQRRPGKPAAAEAKTRIVEISVTSGEVMYNGPAKVGPPISQEELKILAVVLVGVMGVVLLFVLRPDERAAPLTLPEGVTLAEPARRLIAGLIDLGAAALITSRLTRTPALELLTPTNLLQDPASLEAILMLLGIGWLHCTLGEWLFGRSIGKALTGCEVVRAVVKKSDDGALSVRLERPALWRAAVRNLVRWAIPPLALSGMSGMDHRHRGDTAAGTVVVVRQEKE